MFSDSSCESSSSDTDLILQGELRVPIPACPSIPGTTAVISSYFWAFLGMAEVQNWSLTALPWESPVPQWAGIKGRGSWSILDAPAQSQLGCGCLHAPAQHWWPSTETPSIPVTPSRNWLPEQHLHPVLLSIQILASEQAFS